MAAPAGLFADIPGACCFPDGSCDVYTNTVECGEDGGVFAGIGVTCDNADCPATEPECHEPLALSACPTTIVIETRDSDGAAYDASILPIAEGCDVVRTVDPAPGALLSVGENVIQVNATDADGDVVSCQFVIIVDLVDESGPIRKRKLKGGGSTGNGGLDGDDASCGGVLPGIAGPLCGTCPLTGLIASFVWLAACRRRRGSGIAGRRQDSCV